MTAKYQGGEIETAGSLACAAPKIGTFLAALHESVHGTYRTWHGVRLESVMRTKADLHSARVARPYQHYTSRQLLPTEMRQYLSWARLCESTAATSAEFDSDNRQRRASGFVRWHLNRRKARHSDLASLNQVTYFEHNIGTPKWACLEDRELQSSLFHRWSHRPR